MPICDFKSAETTSSLKKCTICDPTWDSDRVAPLLVPDWGQYFATEFNIKVGGPPVYASDNLKMLAAMEKMIWQIGFPIGLSSAWLGRTTKQDANTVQTAGYLEDEFLGQYIYYPDKSFGLWRKPSADSDSLKQYLVTALPGSEEIEGYHMGVFSPTNESAKYNIAFKLVKTNAYGGTQLQVALLNQANTLHVQAIMRPEVLNEIVFKFVKGNEGFTGTVFFNVHIPFVWGAMFEQWIRKNALDRCCIGDYTALDHTVLNPRTKEVFDKDSYNVVSPDLTENMKKTCTDASFMPGTTMCDNFMRNDYCKVGSETANDVQCACLNITDVSPETLRLMDVPGQTHCMSCRCTNNAYSYKTDAMIKNPCDATVCIGPNVNANGVSQYLNVNQALYCNDKVMNNTTDCANGDPCIKGKCVADGTCECEANVYGPTCAYLSAECKDDAECYGGIWGKCVTGRCKCNEGFTGTACDIPLSEFDPDRPYPTAQEREKMREKASGANGKGTAVCVIWGLGGLLLLIGAILWGKYPKHKSGPIAFAVGIIVLIAATMWFFLDPPIVLPRI